jgi:hypothetical protein
MTITLNLQPDIEKGLVAEAAARGVSVGDYVQEIIVRETRLSSATLPRTGQDLIDASAKVRGLLTDEEVDTLFSRRPSFSRPVDFE